MDVLSHLIRSGRKIQDDGNLTVEQFHRSLTQAESASENGLRPPETRTFSVAPLFRRGEGGKNTNKMKVLERVSKIS
jgi:hypothetical protein